MDTRRRGYLRYGAFIPLLPTCTFSWDKSKGEVGIPRSAPRLSPRFTFEKLVVFAKIELVNL